MTNATSDKKRLLNEMSSKVSSLTTAQLCECFVLTNAQNGPEIPTVRGVLMDELQGRDSAAFDQWMETGDTALMDSPSHFFTPSTSRFPAVRRLLCSCCGAVTRGRQWYNRDTGHGLCVDCIEQCQRNETPEQFERCYGVRGVHFDIKEV